jgi:copper chaperone CopZ
MKHTYKISGMTCSGCQAKVKNLLTEIKGVTNVSISLDKGEGNIEMSRHIPTAEFQKALAPYHQYTISEAENHHHDTKISEELGEQKSWFQTYKPILLLFAYILIVTLSIEFVRGGFEVMRWMSNFMAGFFLSFSFFKLLNLQEFANTYSMYDLIASRWRSWAYIYAFIELALSVAFLTGFDILTTNIVTILVMSISIIGVIRSVTNKQKIKCACLGAVFDLPMSTVTIIEDALMIAMSGLMIYLIV